MRSSRKLCLLFVLSLLLLACTSHKKLKYQPSGLAKLQDQIQYLADDPNLHNAHIGIFIESLDNGTVIFKRNAHKLFVPASNMKLYTTAASLAKLGKNHRIPTLFLIDGVIEDSTLKGNLVVVGKGDPAISGRFREGDRLACFTDWADSLKKYGISRIEGELLGDESFFNDARLGDGWNWDDEPYYYSAQPAALSFNDNCVDLAVFQGGEGDSQPKVMLMPGTDYVEVVNNARIIDPDSSNSLEITRQRGKNLIELSGTFKAGRDTVFKSLTVEDPAGFFIRTLSDVLTNKGITINGDIKITDPKQDYYRCADSLLFVHYSPSIDELIKVVNKSSHNLYAEQLLKVLGAKFADDGSFSGGAKVVSEYMHSIGIAPEELIMVDGSGLSRKNFVAPASTAALLRKMYRHPEFQSFYGSLPVAGVDGTLKRRMAGTSAEGNVHAKTGYVRHMRSLAGYVKDLDGRDYLFVIMVNNYSVPTSYVNALQDKICVLLSNYR